MSTGVYLEVGAKKVFACSLDWPGWCRSGKDEAAALDALAEYARRYAPVAAKVGAKFPKNAGDAFDVVERLKGNATTDFGAPGAIATRDADPLTAPQAKQLTALVDAAWALFDAVAAGAPASLRKGPRGGGRDRDKMVAHVIDAEDAYARKLGLPIGGRDRSGIRAALRAARSGEPVKDNGWPPRYAARRIAWHALDHAWEIEDRSDP